MYIESPEPWQQLKSKKLAITNPDRQGVVLTDLQSLVDCQQTLLMLLWYQGKSGVRCVSGVYF